MAIAFVNTIEIEPGTQISFTDNKWTGSALLDNEQTVIWTSPDTALPPGTVVILQDNGSSMNINGPGSSEGRLYHSLGQGEEILAYTGAPETPSFIAGISSYIWSSLCDSIPYLQFITCLPPPLVNGETAIAFVNVTNINIDNGFLNISPLQVTGPEILSIINNINYWSLDNGQAAGTGNWPDWEGGSTQPFASEINFTQTAVQVLEGGSLATLTLHIDQAQFTPQTVEIEILEFPGITPQDYSTNPAAENGIIHLTVPANATDVSFTVQALSDGLTEVNENVTFILGTLSGGLTPGEDDAVSVTILSTEQDFPEVQFVEDTVYVDEGGSAVTINLNTDLSSASLFNVVVNIYGGPGVSNDFFTNPTAFSGQLLFQIQPGSTEASFTVTAFDDIVIEPDEQVVFTIVQVSNGLQIGASSSVVVVLRDNDNLPVFTAPGLFINEINAFNQDFPDPNNQLDDWIELYNAESEPLNIAGYTITNNIENPSLFTFPNVPSQLEIAAGGFKILWADQNTIQGATHLNFQLNPNGGFIGLFGPEGDVLIDAVEYPGTDSLVNYGRFPDGSDNWQDIYFPTPGSANSDSIPVDTTGIFTPGFENDIFSVYPNPSTNMLNVVKIGHSIKEKIQFNLLDASGREMPVTFNQSIQGKSWSASIANLPSGIYLLKASTADGVSAIKVIKSQ
ncbi:MAG: lamin tail domain-containing protein [Bacteroidia bacterium]